MATTYVKWGEATVKLSWTESGELPDEKSITSVHGFCFHKGQVMLVNLNHRGWDIPGGHVDEGETPLQAFQREVMEEGYVEGDCRMIGYITVDHHENEHWNPAGRYPQVGYQVFFRMDITALHSFASEYEATGRKFVGVHELPEMYDGWNEIYEGALKSAERIVEKDKNVKVAAFILRESTDNTYELLVHSFPESDLRVPGGGVENAEGLEAALFREIDEEAGLSDVRIVRKLGGITYYKPFIQKMVERHDYLLIAPVDTPDHWVHMVTGEDKDAGVLFEYRWIKEGECDMVDPELNTFLNAKHIPELY
ncbi:NUDIX hydrolase [Jeotgalibacillus salarius]|uniref:NUDIX domain-containing protein n=1 Tax=Jeotgalibacillus salarius TaxID=546023 RepID=A0A4Y8LEQ8_9BACL|nr:NUDIX domain-containing protein [Jeotgalibacillus salarius]TFD99490.1 NUDIX domain-containing protein [Jeotgalibacillus salarius]